MHAGGDGRSPLAGLSDLLLALLLLIYTVGVVYSFQFSQLRFGNLCIITDDP